MKMSLACLALVAGLFPCLAKAADTASIDVEPETEVRFLRHFDSKIAGLENYSVTFSDGTVVRKARRPASDSKDGENVKLVHAKKKS